MNKDSETGVGTKTLDLVCCPKDRCGARFASEEALRAHILEAHREPAEEPMAQRAKALTCPECGFQATSPAHLGRHRHYEHGVQGHSAGGRHVCTVCGIRKWTPRGLQQHITQAHGATTPGKPARGPGRPRKSAPSADATSGDGMAAGIARMFDAVLEVLKQNEELVSACVKGLEAVFGEAHKLRLAYIKQANRIKQLEAAAQKLDE